MSVRAALLVVVSVGLGRALLELVLAGTPSHYKPIEIINSLAFYAEAFALYTLLVVRVTGRPLERVVGVVVVGVFVGMLPPIIDAVVLGPGEGHYAYFLAPVEEWAISLFDPRFASLGEGVTLWFTILCVTVYVAEVTRSWLRSGLALLGAYCVIFLLAAIPPTLIRHLAPWLQRGLGGAATMRDFTVIAAQLVVAQLAYISTRPGVGRRIMTRLLHGLPFLALVYLGVNARRHESRITSVLLSQAAPLCLAMFGILQMVVVSIAQNDAYELAHGKSSSPISEDDAAFVSFCGALIALGLLVTLERLGLAVTLCFIGSVVYNSPRYAAKRRFPANHKIEGLWAWCAFIAGAYVHPSVSQVASRSTLLLSFLVFGGWSVFVAIKDYKDIRSDYRARNQTLYTLALRRGVSLRSVHQRLRMGLGVGLGLLLTVSLPAMAPAWHVAWPALAAVAIVVVTGGPPKSATVARTLALLSIFLVALAHAIAPYAEG